VVDMVEWWMHWRKVNDGYTTKAYRNPSTLTTDIQPYYGAKLKAHTDEKSNYPFHLHLL
jgi:hypothetical protein